MKLQSFPIAAGVRSQGDVIPMGACHFCRALNFPSSPSAELRSKPSPFSPYRLLPQHGSLLNSVGAVHAYKNVLGFILSMLLSQEGKGDRTHQAG